MPASTVDIDEFRYFMRIRGYWLLPNAITDKSLVRSLATDLDALLDNADEKCGETGNFSDIAIHLTDRGPSFRGLLEDFTVLDLVATIVGSTCILHSYNAVRLMPDRDNNASRIHRDSPRYCPDYVLSVQALYMLDDFTSENGGTWLLPGSHHAPERPSDEQFFRGACQVSGKAGDALIFDSSVWHSGGENRSDSPRRGITTVYTRAFMKQQIDLARSLAPELIATFSERGQRLLGMNVRVPASVDAFNLPPEQRLYKANQG